MGQMLLQKPVTVVVGHYGVGKTNFSLNVALDAAREGFDVTLIDLDIVNPYFRSSEYRASLEAAGVRVVAPVFAEAGSGLDVPSLTGAIVPAIEKAYADFRADAASRTRVVIDVGGDDAGAAALARFSRFVSAGPHQMLYVVNRYRNLTQTCAEALCVMREIEDRSRLRVTGVVANSHLKGDTAASTVAQALPFAREVAAEAGVPLVSVAVPKTLAQREKHEAFGIAADEVLYPVQVVVKTPWE